MQVLTIEPLKNLGTPAEIVKIFGGKEKFLAALKELETEIYAAYDTARIRYKEQDG